MSKRKTIKSERTRNASNKPKTTEAQANWDKYSAKGKHIK